MMVRDAVVESWAAVHENMQELGFQMFGRLIDCENEFVGMYLESVEKVQYGPWLKPMQRLWMRSGGGRMIAEVELGSSIYDIAVQKDPFLAVAAIDKEVAVLDFKEMTLTSGYIGHTEEVKKVGISAERKRVLSWSDDCTVRQWDAQFGREDTDKRIRLDGEESGEESDEGSDEESDEKIDKVTCAAFCLDKSFVITGSWKGRMKVWDLGSGERIGQIMNATKRVKCIEVSPNGRTIAAVVSGEALQLWNLQTFTTLGEELISMGHFDQNTNQGSVWGLQAVPKRIPDLYSVQKEDAQSVTFNEDGRQVFSGHFDGGIIVWDVDSGATIRSWKAHSGCVDYVAVTGDAGNRCVVSVGLGGVVRVWDLQAKASVKDKRIRHDGVVECVAASPNGRIFASASQDKTLRVWDAVDGSARGRALCGHEKRVTCVSISPDSRQVVSGSWDRTVRVWDVATGTQVGDALSGHEDRVTCIAYSGDGRLVVSGSDDHTVRVWMVMDYSQIDEGIGERVSERVRMTGTEVNNGLSNREYLRFEMVLQHKPTDSICRFMLQNHLTPNWCESHRVTSVTTSSDGQKVLSGLLNGKIWVRNTNSATCIYRTQPHNDSWIERIERTGFSKKYEFVTMSKSYEQLWWQLNDEGKLSPAVENENNTGVAQAELQQESVSHGLSSILCHGRIVRLSGSRMKIATLPDMVRHRAWKYDAQCRVLVAGFYDGRVLLFRVECDGMH